MTCQLAQSKRDLHKSNCLPAWSHLNNAMCQSTGVKASADIPYLSAGVCTDGTGGGSSCQDKLDTTHGTECTVIAGSEARCACTAGPLPVNAKCWSTHDSECLRSALVHHKPLSLVEAISAVPY